MTLRLLGAVRLSRHRGEGDPSTSPDRQEASVTAAADHDEVRGEIIGWARDLDVSAIKLSPFQRPSLGAWLSAAKASQYDGIVWARLDRAVRSMADLHTLAQWATTNRKILVFASGPGGGVMKLDMRAGPLDPIPHLIVTILAFAAQMEAQSITERNRDTAVWLREVGRWSGGMYPYHTLAVREGVGWGLATNPETLPVVREIVDRVLAGESKLSISRDLNNRGVPSPREYRMAAAGKIPTAPVAGVVSINPGGVLTIIPDDGGSPVEFRRHKQTEWAVSDGDRVAEGERLSRPFLWVSATVGQQLRSRALLGEVEFEGKPVLGKDGMPVSRCQSVVNRDEWAALQKVLDKAADPHRAARTYGASLLLNVAYCALCGYPLHLQKATKRGKNYSYFTCPSARGAVPDHVKDGTRCTAGYLRADHLEPIVERVLLEHVGHVEQTREMIRAGESHRDELKAATDALADLLERTAGKPEVVQAVYRGQIEAVEANVVRLAALPETQERVEWHGTGRTYGQIWREADTAARRRLLTDAGVRVEAAKAGDTVTLGLFERPEVDAVAWHEVSDGLQVAMFLPRDLMQRAGATEGETLGYGPTTPLPPFATV